MDSTNNWLSLLSRKVCKTIVPVFVLFFFLVVAKKMTSIYLISTSLYRNTGYLYFFEDLGKRKLSFRKLILNLYSPLTILVFDSQKHCSGLCGT